MLKLRGTVWQWMDTIDGQRYRMSTGETDKAKAQEWAKEARGAILRGEVVHTPRVTPINAAMSLKDAFDKAFRTEWRQLKAWKTYDINSRHCMKILGESIRLKDITSAKVAELKAELLDQEYEVGTVNRILTTLSSLLTIALRKWEVIDKRPVFDLDPERNARMRLYTKAEEIAILNNARGQEMADYLLVLADTGCRVGEARNLKAVDIDMANKVLRFWDTKNNDSRAVPMTARVYSMYQRRGATPFTLSKDDFDQRWYIQRKHMGKLEDAGWIPHTFRHTCATNLLEAGVSIYTIQKWLGHKDIKTTMRYAKMTRSQLDLAAQALDQLEQSTRVTLAPVKAG